MENQECTQASCPLVTEPDSEHCVFHLVKEGKSREDILRGLQGYEAVGYKQIRHAYLKGADFSGLYLNNKNFQHTNLSDANFQNARLFKVGFDFSNLDNANFENIILERVDLRRIETGKDITFFQTIFDGVLLPPIDKIGRRCIYDKGENRASDKAMEVYQGLKNNYRDQGHSGTASWFYELEMDMRRENTKGMEKFWLTGLWLVCGYGERPLRTFFSFLFTIVGFALIYFLVGGPNPEDNDFLSALYYSVVTFTTLGYGDINPVGISRLFASIEALVGVFLNSLFIFVFCRKMIR
jgi:hypothetical protein